MKFKSINTGFWAGAFVTAVVCLSASSGHTAPRLRYHVTEIGTLGGPASSRPVAINNHGVVVGKAPGSNWIDRPFVWQDGVMRDLGLGEGEFSTGEAVDINDAGEIVATATVTNFEHGYLVTASGVTDLNVQTGQRIYPTAINHKGLVVGFVPRGFNTLAISWSNGVLRTLGELESGSGSLAYDVNSQGNILVQAPLSSAPPENSIFSVVVRDGQWNTINGIGGLRMNDRGDIAGGIGGVVHAALYQNGAVVDLGALDEDIWSWAHGMNNFGDVVGYSDDRAETPRAFVYTDGEMHDLNTLVGPRSGWNFWVANAINDRGQIVGVGNYKGRESGFLLTPIGNGRKR